MTATRPTTPAGSVRDYSSPSENCDIVMKGGIASGTVYPLAICELATTYRFRNVGGTSAGAIAAAATAAAECGRRKDPTGSAFKRLERLPAELGEPPNGGQDPLLFSLFQPQQRTSRPFAPLRAVLKHPDVKVEAFLKTTALGFPLWTLLGGLPGLLIAVAAGLALTGDLSAPATVLAALALAIGLLVVAPVGAAAASIWGWWRSVRGALPANYYGFCCGFGRDAASQPDHLTQWLSDLIDELAGKSGGREPLLFGDLWGDKGQDEPELDLRMITTNLTLGRPYALPFADPPEDGDEPAERFFFKPSEFEDLFPPHVVEHMVKCAWEKDPDAEGEGLCPLPRAADLPVIVATRLSLSFPFLLSAVPLHLRRPSPAPGQKQYVPCWFSDGGICSNFPVHFFDSPLPRWPTFAINLRPLPRGEEKRDDSRANTWMADREGERGKHLTEEWFTYWDADRANALFGFLGAILDTMQNWRDSAQLAVPGYRDRVVHIGLRPDEGGINLAMSAEMISLLGARGECAGDLLKRCFARGSDPGADYWDAHRWTRFRASAAAIESLLLRVHKGYEAQAAVPSQRGLPSPLTYAMLIERAEGAPPALYGWPRGRRQAAIARSAELTALAASWSPEPELGEGAPTPPSELRLSPHI